MNCFRIAAVFAFIVLAKGCELNEQLGQKIGRECAASHSDPAMLMAIAEHVQYGGEMADPTFLCDYQSSLVNILVCAKNKLAECHSDELKPVLELFPSRERLTEGLKFMCQHKEVLQNRCMSENIQTVTQCVIGKVSQFSSSLTERSSTGAQFKDVVCSVIRGEEQCFRDNRGSCKKEFIETVVEMMEKFFPMSSCGAAGKSGMDNTVLGNILLHGQPYGSLKFKPGMEGPFIIKN